MTERKPMGYWNNKENVLNEALKYSIISEFTKKSNGAYESALRNSWINEVYLHMKSPIKTMNYWSKEQCKTEALKYSTKMDFRNNSSSAYTIASRNKWIKDICKHMIPQGNIEKRFIYKASFLDNSIYVGLTCNLNKRLQQHLNDKNSSVYKYKIESNSEPIFELVSNILYSKDEAAELEEFLIEEYKRYGFNILNKVKGGGLGSCKIYWTFDKIKEQALLYTNRTEFQQNNGGAYTAAQRNGWLDKIYEHMEIIKKQNYWNIERSIEESKKYTTIKDFKNKSSRAYRVCVENKVIKELFPNNKRIKNPDK